MKLFSFFTLCFLLFIISCKKESFTLSPEASLFISADSLSFDTVFTSLGSISKSIKLRNDNDQKIRISKIKLAGGASSYFNTNIDGQPVEELENIEIAAGDSIYVFVTVTINPGGSNLPFLVTDTLEILFNGTERNIPIQAYGRNAVFLRNFTFDTDANLSNHLPFVILGPLIVDPDVILTLDPGVEMYFHADAPFLINGTLVVNGTHDLPVLFTGDRLDEYYNSLPGSWPGLIFSEASGDNVLKFSNIKNAYTAITAVGTGLTSLVIEQSKIENSSNAGLILTNVNMDISNSLISNSASNVMIRGGSYLFTHCTIAGYSTRLNSRPASLLTLQNSNDLQNPLNLSASFVNCIIWGEGGGFISEVELIKDPLANFNVSFDHSLYKGQISTPDISLTNVFENIDPLFDSIDVFGLYFDYHLKSWSPGINVGMNTIYNKDLDNNNRNVNTPDLGAYEIQ